MSHPGRCAGPRRASPTNIDAGDLTSTIDKLPSGRHTDAAAQVQHPGAWPQPFEELLDRPYLALFVREDSLCGKTSS
jgi:hypothetical protein